MDTIVAGIALAYFRFRATQHGGGGVRTLRSRVVKAEKLWEWYRDAFKGLKDDDPVVVTVDQGGHLWRNVQIEMSQEYFHVRMFDSFDFEIPVVKAHYVLGKNYIGINSVFYPYGKNADPKWCSETSRTDLDVPECKRVLGRSTGSMLVLPTTETSTHELVNDPNAMDSQQLASVLEELGLDSTGSERRKRSRLIAALSEQDDEEDGEDDDERTDDNFEKGDEEEEEDSDAGGLKRITKDELEDIAVRTKWVARIMAFFVDVASGIEGVTQLRLSDSAKDGGQALTPLFLRNAAWDGRSRSELREHTFYGSQFKFNGQRFKPPHRHRLQVVMLIEDAGDLTLLPSSLDSTVRTATDVLKERPLLGSFNHGGDQLVIREWTHGGESSLVVLPKSTKGDITIGKVVSDDMEFWVVNPPEEIDNQILESAEVIWTVSEFVQVLRLCTADNVLLTVNFPTSCTYGDDLMVLNLTGEDASDFDEDLSEEKDDGIVEASHQDVVDEDDSIECPGCGNEIAKATTADAVGQKRCGNVTVYELMGRHWFAVEERRGRRVLVHASTVFEGLNAVSALKWKSDIPGDTTKQAYSAMAEMFKGSDGVHVPVRWFTKSSLVRLQDTERYNGKQGHVTGQKKDGRVRVRVLMEGGPIELVSMAQCVAVAMHTDADEFYMQTEMKLVVGNFILANGIVWKVDAVSSPPASDELPSFRLRFWSGSSKQTPFTEDMTTMIQVEESGKPIQRRCEPRPPGPKMHSGVVKHVRACKPFRDLFPAVRV